MFTDYYYHICRINIWVDYFGFAMFSLQLDISAYTGQIERYVPFPVKLGKTHLVVVFLRSLLHFGTGCVAKISNFEDKTVLVWWDGRALKF